MKDINFTFPSRPNVMVLKNVNLNIESNQVTAIVGRSGSGKSTIVITLNFIIQSTILTPSYLFFNLFHIAHSGCSFATIL